MDLGTLAIISIGVLFVMFFVGAALPINIGVMGFVAAFIVGNIVSGMEMKEIFSGFPAELFIILAGVTYFFNIIKENGTIDLITHMGLRLVRGNVGLIPWVMFALSLILCSVGTQGTAAIIIVTPIALQLANKCKINQLMMSLMVAWGMTGGIFSPLNIMGIVVSGVMETAALPFSATTLYLCTLLFSVGLAIITFIIFGGIKLIKKGGINSKGNTDNSEIVNILNVHVIVTPYKIISLIGLAALVFFGLWFDYNMGFVALMIGFVLGLVEPKKQNDIIKGIPWGIIFMLCGIVTYVNVMKNIGVMDYLTTLIEGFDNPKGAGLITSYIGGFVSAFVSTTGFLAGVIPLSLPMLANPTIWSMGLLSCICISASIVDICPFSTTGAIFVANAQGEEKNTLYKRLLNTAAVVVLFGPLLAWLVFVAIP